MQIEIGEIYRHFKGNLYKVLAIAEHSETGEELVIYQALYGENKIYARPLNMFTSLVDKAKYPDSTQIFRFEKWDGMPTVKSSFVEPVKIVAPKEPDYSVMDVDSLEEAMLNPKKEESTDNGIDPKVMEFLDTRDYDRKLLILQELHSRIDEDMIRILCYGMDMTVREGSLEDKYRDLLFNVELARKFEGEGLR